MTAETELLRLYNRGREGVADAIADKPLNNGHNEIYQDLLSRPVCSLSNYERAYLFGRWASWYGEFLPAKDSAS